MVGRPPPPPPTIQYVSGDPDSIPDGGKLNVCLQGALLEDRDDPGQVSLEYIMYEYQYARLRGRRGT